MHKAKKLTSNATFPSIDKLLADRKLIERASLRQNLPKGRHLYVTPAIGALLDGEGASLGFPTPEALSITDRFMAGYLMVCSLTVETNPKRARPDLERLVGMDEAWVMCFRRPRPGWRLFGRFIGQGRLVVLRAHDRHELKGQSVYEAKAAQMIRDWSALFDGENPLSGANVEEYVGGVVNDVSK